MLLWKICIDVALYYMFIDISKFCVFNLSAYGVTYRLSRCVTKSNVTPTVVTQILRRALVLFWEDRLLTSICNGKYE